MKRRKFLKSFAAAVAVVTVAPVAIASVVKKPSYPFMGWFVPGNPPQMLGIHSNIAIKWKPITDDAYDGSKCNTWIVDEVGKCAPFPDDYVDFRDIRITKKHSNEN